MVLEFSCLSSLWGAMAERFSALDLCSEGRVIRMWVQILAVTVVLVSLMSKTLYCAVLLSNQECKWVPVRVEMVIVFDQPCSVKGGCTAGLYTPQGAERDYWNDIGSVTRGNNVKCIGT